MKYTKDSREWMILDFLCKYFGENGEHYPVAEEIARATDLKPGQVLVSLKRLLADNYLDVSYYANGSCDYRIKLEAYEAWDESNSPTETKSNADSSDFWEPLEISNYQEISEKSKILAENLSGDNGYNAQYPEEARYIISVVVSFSSALENNAGKVIKHEVFNLKEVLNRLKTIFPAGVRLAKDIAWLWEKISSFLP